jgi:WD40 repeat protein
VTQPTGHSAAVAWVGFTPDGEHVLTAARDGLRTWRPNGELKNVTAPPEFGRGELEPARLGEQLVWVGYSETGRKAELVGWDRAKGEIGWRVALDGAPPGRVLSSDGKLCVAFDWNHAGNTYDVTVYDGPTGKVLHSWPLPRALGVRRGTWPPMALSPAGDKLFIAADEISGFDLATGKRTLRIDFGRFHADTTPAPSRMAVSADGTRFAVIACYAQTQTKGLLVFDARSGKKLVEQPLGRLAHPALRFSPNGKRIAVWNALSPTVLLCDAESSQVDPRKLEGGTRRATAAAFNPNGTRLVVGYQDGTALVWDVSTK